MSYVVYWIENLEPRAHHFNNMEIDGALKHTEQLRLKQRAGEDIKFVTLAAENAFSVGKPGVDVTGPDYNWKKRRI